MSLDPTRPPSFKPPALCAAASASTTSTAPKADSKPPVGIGKLCWIVEHGYDAEGVRPGVLASVETREGRPMYKVKLSDQSVTRGLFSVFATKADAKLSA